MLTKNDLQQIKAVVDDSLHSVKQDVSTLKTDVSMIKTDMGGIKDKLDELYDFSVHAAGNILDWTNEIHTTIVKKKLPERLERLEKHSGLPQFAD